MSGSKRTKPLVVITPGDPAGIGPQVIVDSLRDPAIRNLANYLIIADKPVFSRFTQFSYETCSSGARADREVGLVFLLSPGVIGERERIVLSEPTRMTARASCAYVRYASFLLRQGLADCLVTGPVSKENIIASGERHWIGHTEFLASECGARFPLMLFSNPYFKAVLTTRHIPLRDVSSRLTRALVDHTIRATYEAMTRSFGIARPRIAVMGLNPHCGEGGKIGKEEITMLRPAVRSAQRYCKTIAGPLSTEAALYDAYRGKYDCLIAMYHDQALGALKMVSRNTLVNITIGLNYIRTSPAHGTAFDVARYRNADPSSFKSAIKEAVRMFSGSYRKSLHS